MSDTPAPAPPAVLSIHSDNPQGLFGRTQQNSIAIHCAAETCNIDFLWHKSAGDNVKCPHCGITETLDVANTPPLRPPHYD